MLLLFLVIVEKEKKKEKEKKEREEVLFLLSLFRLSVSLIIEKKEKKIQKKGERKRNLSFYFVGYLSKKDKRQRPKVNSEISITDIWSGRNT